MENITKVLEAIGKALADKDLQISCLQFNLESTKKALEAAEAKAAEAEETTAALATAEQELKKVRCYIEKLEIERNSAVFKNQLEDCELPIRPEVSE